MVHHDEQEGEVVVHQEEQETEPDKAAAVQEAGANVPVEAPAMAAPAPARADKMRPVLVDKARFSCSLCSGFLKRPIYQCAAGHMVCCSCRFKFRGNGCRRCGDRGVASAYTICPGLGYFFGGLQVPCPNEPYRCKTHSPYFKADDHERACEHAPCRCAEQGCGFAGSPPALLAHLTGDHFWAAHEMPAAAPPPSSDGGEALLRRRLARMLRTRAASRRRARGAGSSRVAGSGSAKLYLDPAHLMGQPFFH
ncbi:hypothetical protein EJB05_55084 [Eragrostis curvula]|uniref:RING-type E3 ubiquitin transferase n=1 Tax=Eragrostis curvula TaxID=38414 RepID=A0A5J9SKR0_9POAL|nr:hypothetical protein EJB05_55084 [Eragrostis curvula]